MVGIAVGSYMSSGSIPFVMANEDSDDNDDHDGAKVDKEVLEQLYLAAFGRPVDEDGKKFHLNKNLKQVLRDINNSEERRYYSALFKAVKAYEEAVRAPGDLSAGDKQKYLDAIDSSLSTLLAWVETLPEQHICKGVIGIIEAREAIQRAYDNMSPAAKLAAQKGIFKALEKLPKDLPLPLHRCLVTPTPTPSVSASPLPTPTQTPIPPVTPTPTPSPSPTVSGSPAPSPSTTPTPTSSPTTTPSPTPTPAP